MVKGMKQTEIGLIPDDWDLIEFNKYFNFLSTASYSRAEINHQGNIGYLHYGDIHTKIKAHLDLNEYVSGYITQDQLKTYTILKEGDLIMADASEDYSGVGKAFEVKNSPRFPVISGLHTFLIRDKIDGIVAKGFKGYFHNNPLIKKQYDSLATGLKVYSLSKNSFKNIQIPLPPLPEQEAIAGALSDADAWIESLEQIIAKKRLIKQGAMQELLTPKEGWEVKKLGEVCDVRDGTHDSPQYFDNGVKFITSKNIVNNKLVFDDVNFISKEDACEIDKRSRVDLNDIIMSMIGTIGNAVLINFQPDFCIKNVALLKPKKISEVFLIQVIKSPKFQELLKSKMDGGIQKFVSLGVLRNLDFFVPKSLTEQTRIATILSDMDAELEALEQQLHKAREIKQGMMQELLTGKIRLNYDAFDGL